MHRSALCSFTAFCLVASGCGSSSTDDKDSSLGGGSTEASGGSTSGGGGAPASGGAPTGTGGTKPQEPKDFWDASNVPPATKVLTFKFLNRTNGKYSDAQVYWSFQNGEVEELHSIAEMPTYDMPANASGRMYFFLGEPHGDYYDFIEFTIGDNAFHGNTTRVDAFGLKLALKMHCADGYEASVGEDYETFLEDRAVTFQKFLDEAPDEFDHLAQLHAPYRIVEPGAGEFKVGGLYEHYYDAFVDELWANNGITIAQPGSNGSGLGAYPDLSAAIYRHVGNQAGTFAADGTRLANALWEDAATFYSAGPANYYAKFWHSHGIDGRAYGFPYDDVGSYSTYISHDDPEYLLVAIGW